MKTQMQKNPILWMVVAGAAYTVGKYFGRWLSGMFALVLMLATMPAFGINYTIWNLTTSTRTFNEYRNGVNQGAFTGGINVLPGEARNVTSTATAGTVVTCVDGNAIYPVYPTAGFVSPAEGTFICFGTNQCSSISKILSATKTTTGRGIAVLKRDGVYNDSMSVYGIDTPITNGNTASWTVSITVCTNSTVSPNWEISFREYYANVTTSSNGVVTVTQTNRDTAVASTGSSLTNNTGSSPSGSYTNTPILWSGQTNSLINFAGTSATAAKDDTLKAGFNVLGQKLNEIIQNQTLNSASGGTGSGGNNDDVVSAIGNFHDDNTNILGNILGILGRTNLAYGTGSGTNATTAAGEASGIISSIQGSNDGLVSDLGSAPSILGGGSSSVFTMSFFGYTLNLDPEVRFPGAAGFFKTGFQFLVWVWLAKYLIGLYLETAKTYATAQTGGLPAIGPWGSGGLIIVAIVAAAIVTAWVAVFALVFSAGLDAIVGMAGFGSGFATTNNGALYLINLFFPVAFIMSCAWTRIIAPLVVTKAIIATASMQRFLLGK